MNKMFSFKGALKTGWDLFMTHWRFIISLGSITILVQFFVNGMQQISFESNPLLGMALWIAGTLISIIISLGWAKVFLSLVRHNHANWDTFKTEPSLWLHFIKVNIWYFLYWLGYVVVAIIPGIAIGLSGYFTEISWLSTTGVVALTVGIVVVSLYMGVRYQFTTFTVLDFSQLRSKAVFKKTGTLTNGSWWRLFLFNIVMGLLILLGIVCIVVGLIIAIPVVQLAHTKVYDILKSRHADSV